MRSSNASFNDIGFAQVIRDIEELNLNLSDLGADAEGQSQNLSVVQSSIAQTSTNVASLANRLTADEAAIASLQSSVRRSQSDTVTVSDGSTLNNIAVINTYQTVIYSTTNQSGLPGMNAATGVFTVPYDGLYFVSFGAQPVLSGSKSAILGISYSAGTLPWTGDLFTLGAAGGYSPLLKSSFTWYFTAGQTLSFVWQSNQLAASLYPCLNITRL